MNYIPKQSRDHADSQYDSYARVDDKGAEFIGNKQIYKHSTLYISTNLVDKSPKNEYCKKENSGFVSRTVYGYLYMCFIFIHHNFFNKRANKWSFTF